MFAFVASIAPDLPQAMGVAALCVVAALMAVLGAAACGPRRLVEADMLTGWAVVSLAVVLIGVPAPVPLYTILIGVLLLALAAAVYLWRSEKHILDTDLLRLVAIGAPIVLLVSALVPSQWDELGRWLPNARYLVEHDVFPRQSYPVPLSLAPGAPHGLAIVMYAASLLTGALAENTGALFNLFLLLVFACLLARLMRMAIALPRPSAKIKLGLWAPMSGAHGWGYCATGALVVTLLNPAFSPRIAFTAGADSATAVAFGFGVVLAWMSLEAMSRGDEVRGKALAWQLGLAMLVLVNLRNTNLALFVILLAGIAVVAWRDPAIEARGLVKLVPYVLVPPLLVLFAWRLHVLVHLSSDVVDLRPIDQWAIGLAPDILSRMGLIAADKAGFFCLMLVSVVFAGYGLARVRGGFDRLAILTGTACVLYQLFLLFAYVASFGDDEARRAASYWRYTTHLGGACLAFATYGGALLWREHVTTRFRRNLTWVPVSLALAFPFALVDLVRPAEAPSARFIRQIGAELSSALPRDSRLAVLDPPDRASNLALLRYELNRRGTIVARLQAADPGGPQSILATLDQRQASHAWVPVPNGEVERALSVRLPPGASYLLKREGPDWQVVRSWPRPGAGGGG